MLFELGTPYDVLYDLIGRHQDVPCDDPCLIDASTNRPSAALTVSCTPARALCLCLCLAPIVATQFQPLAPPPNLTYASLKFLHTSPPIFSALDAPLLGLTDRTTDRPPPCRIRTPCTSSPTTLNYRSSSGKEPRRWSCRATPRTATSPVPSSSSATGWKPCTPSSSASRTPARRRT